jgi:hypothetical protein
MSLEDTLARMLVALETIAQNTGSVPRETPAPPPPKLAAVPAAAPAPAPEPTPEPVAQAAPAARWASQAEVNAYVMAAYKEMGPEKGAQIGNVLQQMGIKAVTELTPTNYEQFFSAVEALKNA